MIKKTSLFIILFLTIFFLSHTIPRTIPWFNYHKATKNVTVPSKTLTVGLGLLPDQETKIAVDIGAGSGKDTLHLLDQGWRVTAIDYSENAIKIIEKRVSDKKRQYLQTQIADFSTMSLPKNIDLVNASCSLPFCKQEEFDQVWANIVTHLKQGWGICWTILWQGK